MQVGRRSCHEFAVPPVKPTSGVLAGGAVVLRWTCALLNADGHWSVVIGTILPLDSHIQSDSMEVGDSGPRKVRGSDQDPLKSL